MDNRYLGMHILDTTPPYTINVIPREKATTTRYTFKITDENLNTTATIASLSHQSVGNYEQIEFEHNFATEAFHYFTLSIGPSDNLVEVYRGKFLITNQTDFAKFTVNENVYTEYEKADANEYIVI